MNDAFDPDRITIRAERPEDAAAIASVVETAFGSPVEARLVEDLRASSAFVPELSLVAELDGSIVGHVMVSYATLVDGSTQHRICSLAPLAVLPGFRRRGVGARLVHAVCARVDDLGEPFVVLEGRPGYYGPLGFEYSVPLGVRINLPDWAPAEAAQMMRLRNYDPSIRGLVVYPPPFDAASDREHARDVRDALVRQWRAIAAAIPSIDLDVASRVAGWRNREVVAHLAMQPDLLVRFVSAAGKEPPQLGVGENLSGTRNLAALVDAATRDAAEAGRIDFAARAEEAIAVLESVDLTTTVTTLQGPILLSDYLVTRCVEAVVHGGDLVEPVEPDAHATRIAAAALVALLATRDPALADAAESMPAREWIAAATGRAAAPRGFERVLPLMA